MTNNEGEPIYVLHLYVILYSCDLSKHIELFPGPFRQRTYKKENSLIMQKLHQGAWSKGLRLHLYDAF